jgi:preprotein translocase subunit SecA
LVSLITIDDLWSEHLATVAELREGIHWVSWGGRDPLHEYLMTVDKLYKQLQVRISDEIPKRVGQSETSGIDPSQRGATWTYLTTDRPFGNFTERVIRGLLRTVRTRSVWG